MLVSGIIGTTLLIGAKLIFISVGLVLMVIDAKLERTRTH